jgi:hypothetical protein
LSDLLSCLQSIHNRHLQNTLVLKIIIREQEYMVNGLQITFIWIRSHIGLAGNTAVDAAAKAALDLPPGASPVPYSDFKSMVNASVATQWQQSWDNEVHNKLHKVQPRIGPSRRFHLSRRDELIIHRLRLGHTHLTQSHLLKGENPPQCTACQCPLSVEHILLECADLAYVRGRFFTASTLRELFEDVRIGSVIDFIKAIGLYHKL